MDIEDDDIVIHPIQTKKDKSIPQTGFLFVNPGEAHYALASVAEQGGERLFLHNSQLAVTADASRFAAGPAIGAPAATLVMEKLIALGAQRIILMGWCGAVDVRYHIGDVVIPTAALSGEGTSQYYSKGEQATPSENVRRYLSNMLTTQDIGWKGGRVWSTDAPYRESKKYLKKLMKKHDVVGVDMEFSALCNVARFRGVSFGAIFLVSDEIMGESWKPGFKNKVFKARSRELTDLLLQAKV